MEAVALDHTREALALGDARDLDQVADREDARINRRTDFETLSAELTARTISLLKKVLRDAKVTADEVQGTVMVGGSTRMPQVQDAVRRALGREPLVNLNPDEVVAAGAAARYDLLVEVAWHLPAAQRPLAARTTVRDFYKARHEGGRRGARG